MDSLAGNLFACSLYIIVPAAFIGFTIYGVNRMRKAAKAEIRDDVCVACDSNDLTFVGEGAYRCNLCGYEGGSGLKKMQEEAHVAAIEAMGDEEKVRSGIADLKDARSILTGCLGTLENARRMSRADLVGMGGGDRGQAKQSELVSACGEMVKAQSLIRDASLKLGPTGAETDFEVDFGDAAFALDVAFDNVIADWSVHGKINDAERQCKGMLEAVERALTAVGSRG